MPRFGGERNGGGGCLQSVCACGGKEGANGGVVAKLSAVCQS